MRLLLRDPLYCGVTLPQMANQKRTSARGLQRHTKQCAACGCSCTSYCLAAVALQSGAAADGRWSAQVSPVCEAPHDAARRMRLQMRELLRCSYCVAATALQLLCCSYCVAAIALQLLRCRYCVAAAALQLLRCSYCVAAIALRSDAAAAGGWARVNTVGAAPHEAARCMTLQLREPSHFRVMPSWLVKQQRSSKIAAPHEAVRRMMPQLREPLRCSFCAAERYCGRWRTISARRHTNEAVVPHTKVCAVAA
jgi:hypothetical protein